jgi:hypothetical protein
VLKILLGTGSKSTNKSVCCRAIFWINTVRL